MNHTATKIPKLQKEIIDLKKEVELLHTLLIGLMAKDQEGAYKPEFIREIWKACREKTTHTFKDSKSFLSHIQS